jgi:hypothetical protein
MAWPQTVDSFRPLTDYSGSGQPTAANIPMAADYTALQSGVQSVQGSALGPFVYNVKDPQFAGGAKGRWYASEDDTAAIQAALNATVSGLTAQCVVYLPPGGYYVTGPLTIPHDNVTLRGAGVGVTQILVNSATMTGGVIRNATPASPVYQTAIEDLTIDGRDPPLTGENGSPLVQYGIDLRGLPGCRTSNVIIRNLGNPKSWGVYGWDNGAGNVQEQYLENVLVTTCRGGGFSFSGFGLRLLRCSAHACDILGPNDDTGEPLGGFFLSGGESFLSDCSSDLIGVPSAQTNLGFDLMCSGWNMGMVENFLAESNVLMGVRLLGVSSCTFTGLVVCDDYHSGAQAYGRGPYGAAFYLDHVTNTTITNFQIDYRNPAPTTYNMGFYLQPPTTGNPPTANCTFGPGSFHHWCTTSAASYYYPWHYPTASGYDPAGHSNIWTGYDVSSCVPASIEAPNETHSRFLSNPGSPDRYAVAPGHLIDTGHGLSVTDYGAWGDGQHGTDIAMAAGSTAISSGYFTLTSEDVGKAIWVAGAGTSGGVLHSTIATIVDAQHATLADAAVVAVSAATAVWGHDDTAALQAAITAAQQLGENPVRTYMGNRYGGDWSFVSGFSGVVTLPPGVYLTSAPLELSTYYVSIQGAGMFSSTIKLVPGSNCNVIESIQEGGTSYGHFRDFSVDGGWTGSTSGSGWYGAFFQCLWENVYTFHCAGDGMVFTSMPPNNTVFGAGNRLTNSFVQFQNGNALRITGQTDFIITGCVFGYCDTDEHTQAIVAPITHAAISVGTGCAGIWISNCYLENAGTGLLVEAGAGDVLISNCNLDTNHFAGAWLRGTASMGTFNVTVNGNRFNANSQVGNGQYPDIALGLTAQGDAGNAPIGTAIITSNQFRSQSTQYTSFCVDVQTSAASYVQIAHNDFSRWAPGLPVHSTAPIDAGHVAIHDNSGYGRDLVINVADYGALGDGSTNDTAAIQAALGAVSAAGRGVIEFPAGVFRLSDAGFAQYSPILGIPANCTLRGAGMGVTVLKLADGLTNTTGRVLQGGGNGITVQDLTLDGNRAGVGAGSAHMAIVLYNQQDVLVDHVELTGFTNQVTQIYGGCSRVTFLGCHVHDLASYGLSLTQNNRTAVIDCRLHDIAQDALSVADDFSVVSGNRVWNVTGTALSIAGGTGSLIADNLLIGTAQALILSGGYSTVQDALVTDNILYGLDNPTTPTTGGYGIRLVGSGSLTVQRCLIRDNKVNGSWDYGLWVEGVGGATAHDLTNGNIFAGNTLRNCGQRNPAPSGNWEPVIYLGANGSANSYANVFRENTTRDGAASFVARAVQIDAGCDGNEFYDNDFRQTGTVSPPYADAAAGTRWVRNLGRVPNEVINVKDYGAHPDALFISDAAITTGTATLSSASSPFTAGSVGMSVWVVGAGASGGLLHTTISTVTDTGHVTLAANASTTVSGAYASIGTDNYSAIQAAWTAAAAGKGTALIPTGTYLVGSPLIPASNLTVKGEGVQQTILRSPYNLGTDLVGISAGALSYVTFRDLTLHGNDSAPNVMHVALNTSKFVNVEITNAAQYGILYDTIGGFCGGSTFDTIRIQNCPYAGIRFLTNTGDFYIVSPDIGYCGTSLASYGGFEIEGSTIQITGGEFYNSANGITIGGGVEDVRVNNCTFDANTHCGILFRAGATGGITNGRNIIYGNTFRGNSAAATNTYPAIGLGQAWTGDPTGQYVNDVIIVANAFTSGADIGGTTQHRWCVESENGTILRNVLIAQNDLEHGYTTAALAGIAGTNVIAWPNNIGYNPQPTATITPPASGSAYTNTDPYPEIVTVSGGTVSAISLRGRATGLTSGVFTLQPGDTLTPTYSAAPTMAKIPQ